MPSFVELVDGLRFMFEDQKEEVAALKKDLKNIILNAEQKKFCDQLKQVMEQEHWTPVEFGRIYTLTLILI